MSEQRCVVMHEGIGGACEHGWKGVRMHMVPMNNMCRVWTELQSRGMESRNTQQHRDMSSVRYNAG